MKSLIPILCFGLVALTTGAVLFGCQMDPSREELPLPSARSEQPGKVDPKYSLSQDRSQFEKLRAEIAPDQQMRNDEKALFAEWMGELHLEPQKVRDKHDTLVRKKRELFNKDMAKIREEYSKIERKNKDAFTKEIEAEREAIKDQKLSREAKNERYSDLDTKRKDFYAAQRENRDEFESDFREKRKDFEDYMKERIDAFNAEHKIYSQRFRDAQKPQ